MTQLPRYSNIRPDFMATGPRVYVKKGLQFEDIVQQESLLWNPEDHNDTGYKYYESHKVLGKLFRAIDERKFLKSLQQGSKQATDESRSDSRTVISRVWEYVRRETRLLEWGHHIEWARDIKET